MQILEVIWGLIAISLIEAAIRIAAVLVCGGFIGWLIWRVWKAPRW